MHNLDQCHPQGLVAAARPPEELDGTAGTFSLTAVDASEEDEEARRNELQKKKAHLQVTAMEAARRLRSTPATRPATHGRISSH